MRRTLRAAIRAIRGLHLLLVMRHPTSRQIRHLIYRVKLHEHEPRRKFQSEASDVRELLPVSCRVQRSDVSLTPQTACFCCEIHLTSALAWWWESEYSKSNAVDWLCCRVIRRAALTEISAFSFQIFSFSSRLTTPSTAPCLRPIGRSDTGIPDRYPSAARSHHACRR